MGRHQADYRSVVSSDAALYDYEGANAFTLLAVSGLRENHRLLDIGCGSLRVGRLLIPYLAKNGYVGLDPNRELVQQGINAELGGELIALKGATFVYDAEFDPGSERIFDFALALSIFSHAARCQIQQCLATVSRVLAPEGLFLATYYVGEESYQGDTWVYPGCSQYRAEDMEELVEEAGLCVSNLDWPQPNRQHWIAIARDPKVLAAARPDESTSLAAERAASEAVSALYQQFKADPLNRLARRLRLLLTRLGVPPPGSTNRRRSGRM